MAAQAPFRGGLGHWLLLWLGLHGGRHLKSAESFGYRICRRFTGLGEITKIHIQIAQRGQRHFLNLHRLNGGTQSLAVLLQPKVHRLELIDALFQIFHIERWRHPATQIGHAASHALARGRRGRVDEFLQEFESGHELAKTRTGGVVAHGNLLKVRRGGNVHSSTP
nr:hypothetical protein [Hydrogenophaga crassostreae]